MAGMSLAAALAGRARVLLVEQETQPGYHATGRSVAFWNESYGGPGVQPLTSASGPLLREPDPAFSERPFLSPRGAIHVGRAGDAPLAAAMRRDFAASGVALIDLAPEDMRDALPGLRPEWTVGLSEPSCADIDVGALLQAYRSAARRGGVDFALGTRVMSARAEGAGWRVRTDADEIACAIVVDAAGAWADSVAAACGVGPLGVAPLRRTVVQLRCAGMPETFPLIVDLNGRFYFKPEGSGRLWVTPHDETPDTARDVAPEEIDVAVAVERFRSVVDWPVEAVERKWAGLRSFAPDRLPIYGFDPRARAGFFWFAGQGGFGIQTAPAAALLGAALLLGDARPLPVARIDEALYAPDRLIG
ncbi:MAG: FAD-binding oxidoreductase [Sphingobium sp.]|nr:FAD-binding oxidoreductase [Sphingobium sp.]